ncbi:MAG: preprotein translocase subunit SecA [Candidatus Dormibacteria bacterium]
MSVLYKVLGDPNKREIKRHLRVVEDINRLEPSLKSLSDEQLRERAREVRRRLQEQHDREPGPVNPVSDEVLPEVFALTREASMRSIGLRHFDVQMVGGIILHQGKIAEMKTGEGKTLVATLALVLNALEGRGAHLVTVNDYLARRDAGWMGRLYAQLGLTVGVIIGPEREGEVNRSFVYDEEFEDDTHPDVRLRHLRPCSRTEAYQADITYGTNNEFGFDYLRDNMAVDQAQCVQRELHYAIVDEVDSILIDEARTPLIISGQGQTSTDKYVQYARLIPRLREEDDYAIDEKTKTASLTEEGIAKMEKLTGISNIYDIHNFEEAHQVNQALRAHALWKRDRDYVVENGQVVIVDEFTGRKMPGRRWSDGLHQAIEAKEGVKVQQEMRTMATITFQNYFRLYHKLGGMTGTALTEAEEFHKIYGLEVVVIPTNRPMVREDHHDVVYRTEDEKYTAVADEIMEMNRGGRPVLVGTVSIEKSERLSRLLDKRGVRHNVLNAKQHEREALIVAEAGQSGAVTIATNMAGRGTDIVLGPGVVDLGGLHIVGTERHESRRIDNQLRGRAGRQGDPGSSRFFLSLEDDLFRIFMGERMKKFVSGQMIENEPLEYALLSRSIESAQSKVEGFHFDARRHVVEYDDVMNKQREVIYGDRRRVLEGIDTRDNLLAYAYELVDGAVDTHCEARHPENWEWQELLSFLHNTFGFPPPEQVDRERFPERRDELQGFLHDLVDSAYAAKEEEVGIEIMRQVERYVMLQTIDQKWVDYLTMMEHLKEGIGLRAYGQRDPLVEYKTEAFQSFQRLTEDIKTQMVANIFRVQVTVQPPPPPPPADLVLSGPAEPGGAVGNGAPAPEPAMAGAVPAARPLVGAAARGPVPGPRPLVPQPGPAQPSPGAAAKLGRNDPCWCGSGQKFKRCHGK